MQKYQFLFIVVILTTFFSYSQEVIENPKQSKSRYYQKYIEITKVELTSNETILHAIFRKREKDSLLISNRFYIEDENSKQKKFIIKSHGVKLNEKTRYPDSEELQCKLVFPTIDKTVNAIDLLVDPKPIGSWKVQPTRGISLIYQIVVRPFTKLSKEDKFSTNTSYKESFIKAKQENKNILLYFTAPWCGPCSWMERHMFSDPEINNIIKTNYITVKVNRDTQQGAKLAKEYDTNGIPHYILLTPENKLIKKQSGKSKKDVFLDFIKLDDSIKPKELEKVVKKPIVFKKGVGLRLGIINSSINNYNADSRTGFTADFFTFITNTNANDIYTLRSGLGFSSKGVDNFSVNYLKVPLEFGIKIFNGSLINTGGGIRANLAPYYAIRLNKDNHGLKNNDYGARFGLSHYIGGGTANTLDFELYYEYGVQDVFQNINGKQNNTSYGVSLYLSL